jgi:hypothetical protein
MASYWQQQLLAVRGLLYMSAVASLVPNFREIEVRSKEPLPERCLGHQGMKVYQL